MTETILVAVISALTSGGLLAFTQFLISRYDDKQGIKSTLIKLEKDGIRTQLLFLIRICPDEETEILKVAEHYFVKLKANWYMTSMFKQWCDERGLEPEWFKAE